MQKILTGLAALAFFVSAAQAECSYHNKQVTADAAHTEEAVAMSTHDGPVPPPVVAEDATVKAAKECPADQQDCAPANE